MTLQTLSGWSRPGGAKKFHYFTLTNTTPNSICNSYPITRHIDIKQNVLTKRKCQKCQQKIEKNNA